MKKKFSILNSQLSTRKGFTLIELLVVMAIIGILATIVTVNLIGVRERSRDAQRKSDLSQIQSALEFYRTDTGAYPAALPNCDAALSSGGSTYLKKTPCDPTANARYRYYPNAAAGTYFLYACLENRQDKDGTQNNPGGTACTSTMYYVVDNP